MVDMIDAWLGGLGRRTSATSDAIGRGLIDGYITLAARKRTTASPTRISSAKSSAQEDADMTKSPIPSRRDDIAAG